MQDYISLVKQHVKDDYAVIIIDNSGIPKPASKKLGGLSCTPVRLCEFPDRELVLAVGFIGLTASIHKESIFLAELKECSKRIYEMPKFIFYALGDAMERVLSCRSGNSGFPPSKVKSQQLSLLKYFKIANRGICILSKFPSSSPATYLAYNILIPGIYISSIYFGKYIH